MFRKERALTSPAVSLPDLFMLYTGTDGNLQKAPRSCLYAFQIGDIKKEGQVSATINTTKGFN